MFDFLRRKKPAEAPHEAAETHDTDLVGFGSNADRMADVSTAPAPTQPGPTPYLLLEWAQIDDYSAKPDLFIDLALEQLASWGRRADVEVLDVGNGMVHLGTPWRPEWGEEPPMDSWIGSPEARARLGPATVQDLGGFQLLEPNEQRGLVALMSGANNATSSEAHHDLTDWLSGDNAGMPAEAQAKYLRMIMSPASHHGAADAEYAEHIQDFPVVDYQLQPRAISGDFAFYDTNAPAHAFDFVTDTQTIPIVVPSNGAHAGDYLPSAQDVAEQLARLPQGIRTTLTQVVLEPHKYMTNPANVPDYAAAPFIASASAGSGGIMRIYPSRGPDREERVNAVFSHEIGHLWAYENFGRGLDDPRWKTWTDAMASDALSVANGIAPNAHEDVAGHFSLYMATLGTRAHEEYRAMVPSRWAVFDRFTSGP